MPFSFPVFISFTYTATTEIYTLSLHDALPISVSSEYRKKSSAQNPTSSMTCRDTINAAPVAQDRKSTRLNSSHVAISYAVFCLKKKNTYTEQKTIVSGS